MTMSRFIHGVLALVLLVGIAGCGGAVAEKPAAKEGETPTPDPNEMKKQMEQQQKYQDQSQAPPSGESK